MILLNTTSQKTYIVTQKECAKQIGVAESTVSRWSKLRKVEVYYKWVLFFDVEKVKVNRNNIGNFKNNALSDN